MAEDPRGGRAEVMFPEREPSPLSSALWAGIDLTTKGKIWAFASCSVILRAMAITMLDIARELGVSVVTVSKVLRNQGNISVATRRRVLRKAKQLNYQTNWIARSLVTRRTFTVGLLLPDFTHSFFAEVAKAIAETIRPHGYHVIISYSEEDAALEKSEIDALVARQIDGLIVASTQSPDDIELFKRMSARNVAFVLIDRPLPGVRASFVGADNVAIGRVGTSHLIEQGCVRIAHLRGPGMGIAKARMEGYRRALEKHGLTFSARFIAEAGFHDETGYEAMKKLLRSRTIPDGVFCYNDPVAIGALKAIAEAGWNVPKDIAVVGAGNVHYSDMLSVPLTTVDQGTAEIGRRAGELLLEQMGPKRPAKLKRILIEPKLVVRQSSIR